MKSAPVRRTYHHGDLKNALIDVALERIAIDGVRALSLRDVARRTGVSHTACYRHFPSKESLLAAIAEQGFRRLTAAMRAAMQAHPDDPVAALQASGVAYVEFGVSHPEHMQIMFGGEIAHHDDYPELARASNEARELLTTIVREGLRTGGLRRNDERNVTLAAWSIVHGLAQLLAGGMLQAIDPNIAAPRELASVVTKLLNEGIVAAAPTRASSKARASARRRPSARR